MEQQNTGSNGGDFAVGTAVGAGVVGLVALISNSAKDQRHQHELQQVYSQGYWDGIEQGRNEVKLALSAKEIQIGRLNDLLKQKDAENARLNDIVSNQAKTLALQQLQLTAPMLLQNSDGDDGNGNS